MPYFCLKCCQSIFPFQNLSNEELQRETLKSDAQLPTTKLQLNDELLCSKSSYLTAKQFQKQYENTEDCFIPHINIQSLNKHLDKLEKPLVQLGKTPDIIAISETKLKANFSFLLEGHNFIQKDLKSNAGGVGMFIKNIAYSIDQTFDLNEKGCEEIWTKIKIDKNEKIIGVIYRHPSYRISNFHELPEHTLENLNEQKASYFICGDINIDLLRSDNDPNIRSYSDILFSLGCLPSIKYPTRVSPTSATLIETTSTVMTHYILLLHMYCQKTF